MSIPDYLIGQARAVPIERVVDAHGIKLRGKAARAGSCPICGGDDRFAISTKKQLFNCRGCGAKGDVIELVRFLDGCDFEAAIETLTGEKINGRPMPPAGDPIKQIYDYTDEDGKLLFQALRLERGGKTFRQRTGPDQKKWSIEGVRLVPFRLPELVEDVALEHVVFIVEGEKDVNTLRDLGVPATTNPMGAGKWRKDFNQHLCDADVVICGDYDDVGRDHVETIARNLHGVAKRVRVLDLKQFWPEIPKGGDVSDWLNGGGGSVDRLNELVADLPDWSPTNGAPVPHIVGKTEDSGPRTAAPIQDEDVGGDGAKDKDIVAKLAALDKLNYGRVRKETAKALGVTATELDKIVREARGKPGREPERWLVEPWDEHVETGDLLASLTEVYGRHVVLPPHGANAMALWTLHAWAIEAAYVTPFLMFVSPEPRCGKSTALALVYRTAPRAEMASNISASAVFRYIDAQRPTLLLDEAETYLQEDESLRGILNSGHTRDTAHVIRLVGDDHDPKSFSSWAPKALASIGKLAATLRDRALIIPMKRRKAGEPVKKLRLEDTDEFATLRCKAQRWANDNIEALKKKRPRLPQGLNDRAEDNWEPLIAIAELAGGAWPALAHKAALSLSQDVDEGSFRTKLLADIRKTFDLEEEDRFASAVLAAKLAELAGADLDAGPWGAFGKSGKPITQRQIAKLLSDYSIFPRTIRIEGETPKGYLREQFEDAFERYLSSISPPPPPPHPQRTHKTAISKA